MANLTEAPDKGNGNGDVQKKYLVPEGYMLGRPNSLRGVIAAWVEGSQRQSM